jgi:ribosomal protein L37AE/L43A
MAPQKDNEIPRAEERRKLSESTKLARDKEKLMPPIQCPHCKKESIGKGAMKKWHFDNCKLKDKNE